MPAYFQAITCERHGWLGRIVPICGTIKFSIIIFASGFVVILIKRNCPKEYMSDSLAIRQFVNEVDPKFDSGGGLR